MRKFTKYPKQSVTGASRRPQFVPGSYIMYQNGKFIEEFMDREDVRRYVAKLSDDRLRGLRIDKYWGPGRGLSSVDVTKRFVKHVQSRKSNADSNSNLDLGPYAKYYTIASPEELADAVGANPEHWIKPPEQLQNYSDLTFLGWAIANTQYVDDLSAQGWDPLCICKDETDTLLLIQLVGERCYDVELSQIENVVNDLEDSLDDAEDVKASTELSNFDDEDGQVTIEDIKEAAAAHNYTGNIEDEIAELGSNPEQLYMIYDDIVSIGTEVAQKNLGSWRLLLPSETEFDEPVISTDSGYYVVCARGSIQLVPIEAEALFGEEEFDEFDEEGGPSVTASTNLNASTQKAYNVTEFTVGEYAAQRSVEEDDVQEWYKDAGEPITHVYEAVNSPYVGIKTESGRYIFDDPEKGPVELSRTEMLEALEGTIGSWGLDEEVPEDTPPDYFVKSSTAAQGDVTSSDWYQEMRKKLLAGQITGTLAYDSEYADEIGVLYGEICEDLANDDYPELEVDGSIQAGRGSVDASYSNGEDYISGDWDFEEECDEIEEAVRDNDSLQDFSIALRGIITWHLSAITDSFYLNYEDDDYEDDEPLEDRPSDQLDNGPTESNTDFGPYAKYYSLASLEEINAAGIDSEDIAYLLEGVKKNSDLTFLGYVLAKEAYVDALSPYTWDCLCACRDDTGSTVLVDSDGSTCWKVSPRAVAALCR